MKTIGLQEFQQNWGATASDTRSQARDPLRLRYDELIAQGRKQGGNIDRNLYDLRKLVLVEGLPEETTEERDHWDTVCSLRAKVWKILLRVKSLDAKKYIELVSRKAFEGESSATYQQIRKDINRTHVKDDEFQRRVSKERLSRVLNCLMHSCHDEKIVYVQGLNYICGVFLFVMPELDAFHCLRELVLNHCPLYFSHHEDETLGAKGGAYLVEQCLAVVNPQLHDHLKKTDSPAELYAEFMYSLNANYPPLDEVVKLWDLMLAFGVHLNVIFTVARIVMQRDALLASEHPNVPQILDYIDAELVTTVTIQLVRQIDKEVFDELVRHPRRPDAKQDTGGGADVSDAEDGEKEDDIED